MMEIERSVFYRMAAALSLAAYAAAFASAPAGNVCIFTILILIGMAISYISGKIYEGWDFFGIVVDDEIDFDDLEAMILAMEAEIKSKEFQ